MTKLDIQKFASKDIYFDKSSSSGYKWLQTNVDFTSTPNIDTNTSSYTAKLYVRTGTGGTKGKSWNGYVKVGNDIFTFDSLNESTNIGSSWVLIQTYNGTIKHNDDGTMQVLVSGSVTGPSGTTLANETSSGSEIVVLDTIPRTSRIEYISNNIIGNDTTIKLNKQISNSLATISYKASGQDNETIIVENLINDYYEWNIPVNLLNLLPSNLNEINNIFYVRTYVNGVQIGNTQEFSYTIRAKQSDIEPTLETNYEYLTDYSSIAGNNKILGYDKVRLTYNATAKYNATIINSIFNNTSITNPYEFVLTKANNLLAITDSRGIIKTNSFDLTNYVDYKNITISQKSVERVSPTSSNIILNLSGTFWNNNFGVSNNVLTIVIKYKNKTSNEWDSINVTPTINGNNFNIVDYDLGAICDYREIWNFQVELNDLLTTRTENIKDVARGLPNWYAYHDDNGEHFVEFGDITINNNDVIQTISIANGKTNFTTTTTKYIFDKDIYVDESKLIDESDLYYKKGETFNGELLVLNGFITSSTQTIRVNLTLPKRLNKIETITCTSLLVETRGINGYLNNASGFIEYVGKSGYTISIAKTNDTTIRIDLTKSSAFSNVNNNTPISFAGNVYLNFD